MIDADTATELWRELVLRKLELEVGLTPYTANLDDGTGWLKWYDDVRDLCGRTHQGEWVNPIDPAVWSVYSKARDTWQLFFCCVNELCWNGRDPGTEWVLSTEWVEAEVARLDVALNLSCSHGHYVDWYRRALALQGLTTRSGSPPSWWEAAMRVDQMLREFEGALDFYFKPGRGLWEEQPVTAWRVGVTLGTTALAGGAVLTTKWEKADA